MTRRLRQLHAKLIRNGEIRDKLAAGKLLSKIALSDKSSNLSYTKAVFSQIRQPLNIFIWNSMIRGYAHSPFPAQAVVLYRQMLLQGYTPNNYTYPFLLKASTQLTDLRLGLTIHGTIIRRGFDESAVDPFILTSLVNLYATSGSLEIAHKLFDSCPISDVTCWNALIKGYIHRGSYLEAINVFRRMHSSSSLHSIQPDEITMLNVVSACAHLGALDMGRWIHTCIERAKIKLTVNLGTALINMYSRCGEIDYACSVFDEMRGKDVRTWSVMIDGLAVNGHANKALNLFSAMQPTGVNPDSVTFTGVLRACAHAGFVDQGLRIMKEMSEVHLVSPTVEHYGCIVDLLGRAGRLEEALVLIKKIPAVHLDVVLWGSLLVACRVHKNIKMGKLAAKKMLQLDACNAGALVFLSNIYASFGDWTQVRQVRDLMKERGIMKPPGSSLIEIEGVIHEFLSGDRRHCLIEGIYVMLDDIMVKLRDRESTLCCEYFQYL